MTGRLSDDPRVWGNTDINITRPIHTRLREAKTSESINGKQQENLR